jgi:hypothetical protein
MIMNFNYDSISKKGMSNQDPILGTSYLSIEDKQLKLSWI